MQTETRPAAPGQGLARNQKINLVTSRTGAYYYRPCWRPCCFGATPLVWGFTCPTVLSLVDGTGGSM